MYGTLLSRLWHSRLSLSPLNMVSKSNHINSFVGDHDDKFVEEKLTHVTFRNILAAGLDDNVAKLARKALLSLHQLKISLPFADDKEKCAKDRKILCEILAKS